MSKKILAPKNVGSKKMLAPKYLLVQKEFWDQKYFYLKNFDCLILYLKFHEACAPILRKINDDQIKYTQVND